ncbi:Hypothetical predicted protein [Pelobates cultripes]|uniref:Ubiquitin carboxyl-terminal hydrolase MINDY n=1 Tax=Pelobates cultripes TaxID=61616 RepID=A0AAD1RUM2_PELCU|nr:Hypothetical predicted protein [Pelobates cultripes]
MVDSLVEAVSASLVREFLNGKRLKRSFAVLEEELPRTTQSISNRNELRHALHLDNLYNENKLKGKPFKTLLEIITSYFLEQFGKAQPAGHTVYQNPDIAKMFIKGRQPRESESSQLNICDISDDENGSSTAVSDTSKTEIYRRGADVTVSKRDHMSKKSEILSKSRNLSSEPEIKHAKECKKELSKMSEPTLEETNSTLEALRPKSSRIMRGMMSGPIASSQEDSLKKKGRLRSASVTTSIQTKNDVQVSDLFGRTVEPSIGSANTALQLGKEFTAKVLLTSVTSPSTSTVSDTLVTSKNPFSKQERQCNGEIRTEHRLGTFGKDDFKTPPNANSDRQPQFTKKKENDKISHRKMVMSSSNEVADQKDALKLDDVEDELVSEVMTTVPMFPRSKIQLEGKPVDLPLAVGIKKILFGSTLCCFSEEWKMQSFTFSNQSQVKYGFVQKKGGPCGVLAAVQACMLKNLLFIIDAESRTLQPSDTQRTRCLCQAIADILWRAGDSKEAIVALSSGRQLFSPAGRYKADGILENLMLYSHQKYEDLMNFLLQNIGQFEFGPFGCILLTVSVVLSRSVELVLQDFDVPTNNLIGAHAYCTQELVNLILGGRAVSNVFNDVMELDSGNGNVTLLKGVAHRSEIGFLSLFEHYNVCQVGSYLKTPKYPIWVVCSESHFSVLFCLRKELMNDWKIERRFDLYYYDGLANQQEEIRLTVDTAEAYIQDTENDLTPPLEYCIRTKWKGATIDWNGIEPIL